MNYEANVIGVIGSEGKYGGYIMYDPNTEWNVKYGKLHDLAVVFEHGACLNEKKLTWLKSSGILDRLASLHVVYPYDKVKEKKVPLKALRNGWKRVCYEIEALSPSVKRILVLCSSDLLNKCIVPELDAAVDTAHGTIFNIKLITNTIECVPTFYSSEIKLKALYGNPMEIKEVIPEHQRQWFNRDVKRFLNLKKPISPLSYITSLPDLSDYQDIVIDLETEGLDAFYDKITTIGIQWSDSDRALITNDFTGHIETIKQLLRNGSHITYHNGQFDLSFFDDEYRKLSLGKTHCTLSRARATGELNASLKHLVTLYTSSPGNYAWIVPGVPFNFTDPQYVCEDIDGTWQLMRKFKQYDTLPVVKLFEECIVMAADQTINGSYIDIDALNTIETDSKSTVARLESELTLKYGVHPNKNDELIPSLQAKGYKFTKRTKGGDKYALDEEVLEEFQLLDILEYRKAAKLDSAFVGKLKALIRPNNTMPHIQSLLAATTGRSTMSRFNWQQAGKKGPVKGLLISRHKDGFIFNVDLQGAELNVAAYISNDRKFAKALLLNDMHSVNASKAFEIPLEMVRKPYERHETKTFTFRAIYLGRPQNDMQQRVYDFLKTEYKVLFDCLEDMRQQSMRDNKITDYYGKTNNLLDILDYRNKWAVGRSGANSPIQGLSSHIAFEITLYIWKRLINMRSLCLFGVHDSVVLDVHPDEFDEVIQIVKDAFTNLWNTIIKDLPLFKHLPMKGDLVIARSWGQSEESNESYNLYIPAIKVSSH